MSGIGRRFGINPMIAGFIAGVLIALVVGVMATINLQYGAPWASNYTLTAQVSDADSMAVGSDVRIAGRLVGQVTSITAEGAYTDITFHVDGGDWPLPADTSAEVRLATLLGQKYVQLNPGTSRQKLADGATIPLRATKPVVDFDQILDTFNKPTRDELTQLLRTLSASVQGQEGTLQQLLPDLGDLSVNSQVPTQELVTRDPEFNQILINLGITAQQLAQSRDDLAGVIDNLNSVSATLASNQGTALKQYITNTDTINQTTSDVLGGGRAAELDSGLQQVGTFANYLNSLLTTLIPQTQTFSRPLQSEPSDNVNGNDFIPSRASIDLIYEIGDATSQGDSQGNYPENGQRNLQGNFFLRQNAVGIDPCSLVASALPSSSPVQGCPAPGSASSTQAQNKTPLLPLTIPQLNLCLPLLPCPGSGGGSGGGGSSGGGGGGGGGLPTVPPVPVPTPTLPVSDDVHIGDMGLAAWLFPVRYR